MYLLTYEKIPLNKFLSYYPGVLFIMDLSLMSVSLLIYHTSETDYQSVLAHHKYIVMGAYVVWYEYYLLYDAEGDAWSHIMVSYLWHLLFRSMEVKKINMCLQWSLKYGDKHMWQILYSIFTLNWISQLHWEFNSYKSPQNDVL